MRRMQQGQTQQRQRVQQRAGFQRFALLIALHLVGSTMFSSALTDMAAATTFETREKALKRVFPKDITLLRKTVFLASAQVEAVQQRGHVRVEHERITYYIASIGDSLVGYAYLDTHPVRSMKETLLIVMQPQGSIASIDVLAFNEPLDYLPISRWFKHLAQHPFPHQATPGDGSIDAVSGATLSTRAATDALRRVSSIDHVLHHAEELVEP